MLGSCVVHPPLSRNEILFGANLLAANAAHVAVCTDPGANVVVVCVAISFDDDRATGVVLGDSRHQLRVVLQ